MLTGVFAPLPTPFDDRDEVDLLRLRAALDRWTASPLTGFVVLGTNGEAGLMTDDECDLVIDAVRTVVPRTRPLIAGTGRESTRATIAASRRAAERGVDAVLVRTPSFFKSRMTDEAFVRHYTAVADASPVPVLLYNFTAVTGVDLLPAAVAQLAGHPNIIGMKESGSDILRMVDLVAQTPRTFSLLGGSGSIFLDSLRAGAAGGVLALACLLPEACVRLYSAARENREDEARALQAQLTPVTQLLSASGVPGLKAALKLLGCDVGRPRPPLAPVGEETVLDLRDALARFEEVSA